MFHIPQHLLAPEDLSDCSFLLSQRTLEGDMCVVQGDMDEFTFFKWTFLLFPLWGLNKQLCSQLSLHTWLGAGKRLLNSRLHFSAVGLLDGFMELLPAQTAQILMSHEEEVVELCPVGDALPRAGSCILPSAKAIKSGPGLGFCLDFACVRMGAFPGVAGVVHTPWISTGN